MVNTPERASAFGRRRCGSSEVAQNHGEAFEGGVITGLRTGMPPDSRLPRSRMRAETNAVSGAWASLRFITRRSCSARSRAARLPVHLAMEPTRPGKCRNNEDGTPRDQLEDHALEERPVRRRMNAAGDLVASDTLPTMHATSVITVVTSTHDSRPFRRTGVRGRHAVHGAAA